MNRINLINFRQQATSLAVAAVMTVAVLASLGTLANGYHDDVARAEAGAVNTAAVQQVVITGKRHAA